MLRVSLASDVELVPGQTVVIFDEVQECPSVVSFIKFLVQKYDYRFILSGSLLGTRLRAIPSLPIGYVTELKMYPLDFQEFCQACGVSAEFFDVLQQCLDDLRPVPDFIYDRFIDLWHRYLLVGGVCPHHVLCRLFCDPFAFQILMERRGGVGGYPGHGHITHKGQNMGFRRGFIGADRIRGCAAVLQIVEYFPRALPKSGGIIAAFLSGRGSPYPG